MTKIEAYRFLSSKPNTEASFLANVVLTRHQNAAKRLKTLATLAQRGVEVRIAHYSIDTLIVSGYSVPWTMLDGEPRAAAEVVMGYVHALASED